MTVCIAVLGGMAQAGTIEQSAVRSAQPASTRPVAQSKHARKTAARKNWRKRGQRTMEAKRVRQIQAALIRENYLKGRASGVWDQRSKLAMARFQSDNRWQSKVVPDSRALIKLGLGPDHAGLINPETAAIDFIPGGGAPGSGSRARR